MCHLDNLLLYTVLLNFNAHLKNFYFRHETSKLCCFAIFFLVKKSYFSVSQSTTEKTISTNWQLTHFVDWFISWNYSNISLNIILIIIVGSVPVITEVCAGGQWWWWPWGRASLSPAPLCSSSVQTFCEGRKQIFIPAGAAGMEVTKLNIEILVSVDLNFQKIMSENLPRTW